MGSTTRKVLLRLLCIGLFLGAYATVWRSARAWIAAQGMAPLLTQIDTPRAETYTVSTEQARAVTIYAPKDTTPRADMAAPTGFLFVIGSVFLLAVYPTRPYWVYLGAYQWVLGGLMVAMLAIGIGWAEWGFQAYSFLAEDVYRGTSLGLPLVFAWLMSRTARPNQEPTREDAP